MKDELDQLRGQIDVIDQKLVELINKRAEVVVRVGQLKRSVKGAPPIYAADRERAVLDKVKGFNKGPLPDKVLLAVYRELMSGSFLLERPLRIAYLGPGGSFSHAAAMLKFGQSVEYEPQTDIRGVFDEIGRGHCDFGVVPVENSIAGGIIETLDSLIASSVVICAEMRMAVHHCVMANCGLEDIKVVCSKPEVFAQCRNWLASTLPQADRLATPSTAHAARDAATEPGTAAIGAAPAAELYGLRIICENIEDISNNVTRFFVIGAEPARRTGNDKTTLVFSTADRAGALLDCLQVFQRHNVNLSNIESRQSTKRQKEYFFFVDCEGHQEDEAIKAAMREVRRHALHLSVLGSYPRSQEVL